MGMYDIDDLGAVVTESREEREREAQKAATIVEFELESFLKWLDGLDLVPAIKDIRTSIERLRDVELDRHRAWLAGLEPDERARIESLTRGMVNKLLHRILSGLRNGNGSASTPDSLYAAEVARRLLCSELALEGASLDDDSDDEEGL
jgi:glutamyl-tRNA reductase